MRTINWGIIGLGNIAHQFVKDLSLVTSAKLMAVASRTASKAQAFADQYGAVKAYGSYQDLIEDRDIDIIYIATPHDSHLQWCIEGMSKGKHVLCEKPLAVNAMQVEAIIAAAKGVSTFIMEAFWTRFNPSIVETLKRIKRGDLGEVNYINADFTFYRDDPLDSRMLNANLAGGSLLDMGVYPVFLAYLILGKPQEILALGHQHQTGADLQTAAILKYPNGVANLMSGFRSQSDMRAKICGTKGSIILEPIWHETQGLQFLNNRTQNWESVLLPTSGKGFVHEIEECHQCIQGGKNQSDLWRLSDSLEILRITDEIRRQIGVRYPFERQ
ncbi:MAG: Gfo/Idh/MocA family oxidoreductase [Bacteroidota bacterium]